MKVVLFALSERLHSFHDGNGMSLIEFVASPNMVINTSSTTSTSKKKHDIHQTELPKTELSMFYSTVTPPMFCK
uniref:Uncharacterized protein n=1 Tax=Megaselia scalaris TaxID=36166 RepID=T1GJL6_MEGSC